MDKQAWRQEMLKQQKELTDSEWDSLSNAILERVLQYSSWQKADSIAVYHSVGREVDTLALIRKGWAEGKSIYLPKCLPRERKLVFYKLDSFEQLEVVYMGIPEPRPSECSQLSLAELELIIVPGLAFDRQGFRLGYGGGYYDRFLVSLPNDIEKLSLAFSFQVIEGTLPREEYDLPVDTLLTDKELIICTRVASDKE